MRTMFRCNYTGSFAEGTVVEYRKAAVDAYLLIDTGNGAPVEITITRPRFDTMGISKGTKVRLTTDGALLGVGA